VQSNAREREHQVARSVERMLSAREEPGRVECEHQVTPTSRRENPDATNNPSG
jgi:hypothetical protein